MAKGAVAKMVVVLCRRRCKLAVFSGRLQIA